MTVTNTSAMEATGQSDRLDQAVPEQLALEGLSVAEDGGGGVEAQTDVASATAEPGTQRAFVPSNRERILQQLGALVLSPDFPPSAGTPADASRAPLVIHDGLRSEEIDILAAGRPQRFPVLAEIRSEACRNGAGAFGILDVAALHFRNEDELSDFRLRPVDELDTEHLPCLADPSLFALDGAPRFGGSEEATTPANRRQASSADRIAGAISCSLELAAVDSDCRQAVADLLSGKGPVPWLECLGGPPVTAPGTGPTGAHEAIVRAFIEHDRASPSRLVEEIGRRLGELPDPDVARALPAWLDRADAVLSNRMVLDGKVLSDDGTIALRAAILAMVVEDVKDLAAFLYAQRPAGRQVVVAAAFLIGLRTGIADLSWHRKLPHLELLSPLLVALLHPEPATGDDALAAFRQVPNEEASPTELALYWRDRPLLRWVAPRAPESAAPVPVVAPATINGEVPSDQESAGAPENAAEMKTVVDSDGRVITVMPVPAPDQLTSLRFVLRKEDQLRKSKILQAACTPGICWRVGVTEDGVEALYADIPAGSADDILEAMILKLPAALSVYLAPAKQKRATKPTKRKAVEKDPT